MDSRASAPGQFSFYGLNGLNSARSGRQCRTGQHDQFDFWLGEWDVFGPSGAQAGTNRVVGLLDNCLVEENWTGFAGGRGRSMNAYDAAAGEWSQYWIDQFGLHLRLTGGLEGGAMKMQGPHLFQTQSGGLLPVIHRIRWTPDADGSVNQFWDVSTDKGTTFPFTFFNGEYVPSPDFQPAPPFTRSFCTSPEYDELDAIVGTWRVETAAGRTLGTSTVREDLENCLIEEDFAATTGYESQSFFGWDVTTETWYRNLVDSGGNRILLSGGPEGDAMVLSGVRSRAGGHELHVRLTIRSEGPDRVVQSWETANEPGAWRPGGTVVFVRG